MKQVVLTVGDEYDGSLDGCHVLFGRLCGLHKHGVLIIVNAELRERIKQLRASGGSLMPPQLEELLTCVSNSAATGVARMFSVGILVARAEPPKPPPSAPGPNPALN